MPLLEGVAADLEVNFVEEDLHHVGGHLAAGITGLCAIGRR